VAGNRHPEHVLAAIGWGIYEIYQLGHPATRK
jgi:hypothetical protein